MGARLQSMYPNLNGLACNSGGSALNNSLLSTFGANLEYLFDGSARFQDIHFSTINFENLQQLQLYEASSQKISDILKTAKNLRKLFLFPSISNDDLKTVIPQIFERKSLEYFHIVVNARNFAAVFDGIGCGLFKTKKTKRKQIKIRVTADIDSKIGSDSLVFNVAKVMNSMKKLNVRDFMFILDLEDLEATFKSNLNNEEILNGFGEISSQIEAVSYGLFFTLTNKDCAICGWDEQWMTSGFASFLESCKGIQFY